MRTEQGGEMLFGVLHAFFDTHRTLDSLDASATLEYDFGESLALEIVANT